MIEIPRKFVGLAAVNAEANSEKTLAKRQWKGAEGLAEDVRHYGQWMRDEAKRRIGHLYPEVEITSALAKVRPDLKPLIGQKLTVIAWLWARTVKSPNPAFADVDVPLVSTFMLSTKPGKETYVEPVIENSNYHFTVKVGKPKNADVAQNGTKLSRGANFRCVMSGTPIDGEYIKAEGKAGRMGVRLMAIVAEGERARVYVPPMPNHEAVARQAAPEWRPDVTISGSTQYLGVKPYGMEQFSQLFTDRQTVALTTFSDLVREARERVLKDAEAANRHPDSRRLSDGGTGAVAYADAVSVYLAFGVDRSADFWCSLCIWANQPKNELVTHVFGRQALPMTWDFGEVNVFSKSGGNFLKNLEYVVKAISVGGPIAGVAVQADAQTQDLSSGKVVSTDPPYYDNVPYADLADFFYIWMRRSLRSVFPKLFETVAVPKAEELVAFAYRHFGKSGAEAFFLKGMTHAMHRLAEQAHHALPVTIYYAFKQTESEAETGTTSTGWETFLDAVIRAGFAVTGTWPVRTEREGRMRQNASNALASSIVLVCRPRLSEAKTATRRDFLNALKSELPAALTHLQRGNIAPVDLAQAAIGPGMAVYSRYAKVLDADGQPLSVRDALSLINETLDEVLAEQEGDFDADSRWAVAWFDQSGFAEGAYGVAETLATAKNTSVAGLVQAGILASKGGKVRLFKAAELSEEWNPATDSRLTAWETVHQLVRVLEAGGESAAAALVANLGSKAEVARELAYRLYTIAERKKRAAEALSYNGLVQSWPEIMRLARDTSAAAPAQAEMFG
jgi:putative DNA methylase